MNCKFLFTTIAFLFLTLTIQAQDGVKFGKVSEEELEMEVYPQDSSANAVVLYEGGSIYFDSDFDNSIVYNFEYVQRIKILSREGLDESNMEIVMFDSERLSGLKGYVHNLVDGKKERESLPKSSIHDEQTTEDITTTKITFPNVKEGSIVELRYRITSERLWNLQEWNFQRDIPVHFSEYTVNIPDFLHYKTHVRGYEKITKQEKTSKIIRGQNNNVYHWESKNMPAFVKEPFMVNARSFRTGVVFELSGIYIPGRVHKNYSSSWEQIVKELMKDDSFYRALSPRNYLSDIAQAINNQYDSDAERIAKAHAFVRDNINWNEEYGFYVKTSLRRILKEQKGTAAEMNLLLVALLQEMNMDATPVLVSTRGMGMLNTFLPRLNSFNYVIATVKLNDQEILLDASDKNSVPGILPYRCLNGHGLKVQEGGATWLPLNKQQGRTLVQSVLSITPEGELKGEVRYVFSKYKAYNYRDNFSDYSTEEIKEDFMDENAEFDISNFSVEGMESPGKKVQMSCSFSSTGLAQANGDLIYVNPIIVERQETNPFSLPDRKYPVDFGYARQEQLLTTLMIPEGYEVESLPESIQMKLPNNAGSFQFFVQSSGNSVQIRCVTNIAKPVYIYNEYPALKEFFNQVVKKESEMVILKKKSA
jgi:hypothetical protein